MNAPAWTGLPDLRALLALFPSAGDLATVEYTWPAAVPPPYHGLLVHEHHMTVTVEAYHGDLVDVKILARRHHGHSYARKILLTLQKTGRVVQFGIVRVNLRFCTPAVRDEILAGQTPFGRILINHNVMRTIEPTAFLRVTPGRHMMKWFGLEEPKVTYGRLALIHCDNKPAVELLEIVAPE